ncbi:M23 family metallopeptidase [Evansella sp. AB-P1]|uniref:peptidoglycan DD-metalloendopeptidase family protein n=1 Tax=Evansella sp. AB-P1 TaxID=3037653 RepID=UPI00241DD3BF|nr:M23 family metallopeptidase [Evansella sp. AB-P1]MDG5788974.1 M23 family metallopeptidase [Evansella sp. AB-P1]
MAILTNKKSGRFNILKHIVPLPLLLLGLLFFPTKSFTESDAQGFIIDSVYHLYSDDEHIGVFFDKNEVEQFFNELLEKNEQVYSTIDLTFDNNLRWVEERVFRSISDPPPENDINKSIVEDHFQIVTEAKAVQIKNKVIGYIPIDTDTDKIVDELIEEFIDVDDNMMEEEIENLEEVLSVGESFIQDITIEPSIDFKKTTVSPKKVTSFREIEKEIFIGGEVLDTYEVQAGDVLGKIAKKYNMTIEELLEINPTIHSEEQLQIGTELTIETNEPLIEVIITRFLKEEEAMEYNTIVEKDSSLWKGETYTKQEGNQGRKEVVYKMITTNNKIEEKEVIQETIVKEKTDKIVVEGTKEVPSRGTGNFTWPTNGGVITTYQGMRWGSFHKGIDIARPNDYSILAADNGTVTFVGWINGYGNTIAINHNNGYRTQYAHLASMNVQVGDVVSQGSKIGVMGSTGISTGIHLDFEVYYNGNLLNPMDVLPSR